MAETTMHIDSIDLIMGIFGAFDENMKVLEKALDGHGAQQRNRTQGYWL